MRPKIVCICGSTRFAELHAIKKWELEKDGETICLGITYLPEWYAKGNGWVNGSHFAEQAGNAETMDNLHRRKIDLADEVYIVNWAGYIGESTQAEIEYAESLGKPVKYMYPDDLPAIVKTNRPSDTMLMDYLECVLELGASRLLYAADSCGEDDWGLIPGGFSLRTRACQDQDVAGPTLRELLYRVISKDIEMDFPVTSKKGVSASVYISIKKDGDIYLAYIDGPEYLSNTPNPAAQGADIQAVLANLKKVILSAKKTFEKRK